MATVPGLFLANRRRPSCQGLTRRTRAQATQFDEDFDPFFHTKGGFRSDSFPCHSSRTGNDGFVRFGNDARPTLSGPQRRTLRRHPEFRRVIRRRDASCSSPSSICCPLDVVSESLGCYSAFMNSWGIPTSHIRTTSTDDPLCPALKHIPVQ